MGEGGWAAGPSPHTGPKRIRAAMFRLISAIGFLVAFAGAAHWVVPMGRQAVALVMAQEDAAKLADLQLDRVLDAPRVSREIEDALKAEDGELAASFVALADAKAIPVDPTLRARVAQANAPTERALRGAGRFGQGFVSGTAEDLPGLAGAVAGDLTVWGDIRDGGREALHWLRGEEVDPLVLGLSGVGIAATGATYAVFGAPLTIRAGLSLMKGAKRSGVMGAKLAGFVTDSLRGGRRAALGALMGDVGTAASKGGTRATLAGLRFVDDPAGAAKLRRLSEVKGGQTLAVVKTLGRGALFLTEALAKLAYWIIALIVNAVGLVASFNAAVVAMIRPLWRKKRGNGLFRLLTAPRPAVRTAF